MDSSYTENEHRKLNDFLSGLSGDEMTDLIWGEAEVSDFISVKLDHASQREKWRNDRAKRDLAGEVHEHE